MYFNAWDYQKTNGVVTVADQPYAGVYQTGDACARDPKYATNNKRFISGNGQATTCDALK